MLNHTKKCEFSPSSVVFKKTQVLCQFKTSKLNDLKASSGFLSVNVLVFKQVLEVLELRLPIYEIVMLDIGEALRILCF